MVVILQYLLCSYDLGYSVDANYTLLTSRFGSCAGE